MKTKYTNILLLLSSLLITYLAVEFLVFKHFIRDLPLNRHIFLPESVQLFAQSSKRGVIPEKDYIAIFGDSYALGYGDWLFSIDPNKNPAFHSAHVLHELTGKDIVSFGKSNRGSLGGIVLEPIKKYQYIHNLIFYEIPKPSTIIIYFYEGNDLDDNLKHIRRKYTGRYDADRIFDHDYFEIFIDDSVKEMTSFNVFKNFIFGRFICSIVAKNISSVIPALEDEKENNTGMNEKQNEDLIKDTNKAAIGNTTVTLPPFLQGPSLGLDNAQMKLALYVLDQSLRYIKNYFKETRYVVAYIPSVISSYDIVSQYVSDAQSDNQLYLTKDMYNHGNYIADNVKHLTEKNGMYFIDTRPDLRNASGKEIIHGPNDWEHLNKKGYQVLARSVFEGLKKLDLGSKAENNALLP